MFGRSDCMLRLFLISTAGWPVGYPAVLPDLQLVSLGWQAAELDHGDGEVGIPLRWVVLVFIELAGGEAIRA